MTETHLNNRGADIDDLEAVRPGQHIEVWDCSELRYQGLVEEVVPRLGVLWIREMWTGKRKMVTTDDYSLRHY